jgi:hypothetical protein
MRVLHYQRSRRLARITAGKFILIAEEVTFAEKRLGESGLCVKLKSDLCQIYHVVDAAVLSNRLGSAVWIAQLLIAFFPRPDILPAL